ncbi:hypothetical protein LCGC14_2228120, partial [marine sediment metagenome]
MRSLSSTLTDEQERAFNGGATNGIWKLILSRNGQTTRGYDKIRILSMPFVYTED